MALDLHLTLKPLQWVWRRPWLKTGSLLWTQHHCKMLCEVIFSLEFHPTLWTWPRFGFSLSRVELQCKKTSCLHVLLDGPLIHWWSRSHPNVLVEGVFQLCQSEVSFMPGTHTHTQLALCPQMLSPVWRSRWRCLPHVVQQKGFWIFHWRMQKFCQ